MKPFNLKSEIIDDGCLRMEMEDCFDSELDRHIGQALEKLGSFLNQVNQIFWADWRYGSS